jgi:UDP-N-acetylmuramate--alanine ligase
LRAASARQLKGRRLWFAGIGGAGLSGYALLAHAWGAEVAGWDRNETPYLRNVRAAGIDVSIGDDDPAVPAGWEAVVSSAFSGRIAGRPRADFLAELVALQRSIVVAGAHGKTTTAAMIAYALDRLGLDPSFLIGGDVPQLGGNARAGRGWLIVEGDESDRTISVLRPEIAVVTNLDLDHHTEFASRAEVAALFDEWLAKVPVVVRGDALTPVDFPLALSGEHNRRNAATAVAALERTGVATGDAARALGGFEGVGRRLELRAEDGIRVYDDYAHHPAEVAATIAAARELGRGRIFVLFQPHLYSRTRHLAREFAAALSAADVVAVTDVYRAREEPLAGVSGKLIVDALATVRPGMALAWSPTLEAGARFISRRVRTGDLVLTMGAGDVDRAVGWFHEH